MRAQPIMIAAGAAALVVVALRAPAQAPEGVARPAPSVATCAVLTLADELMESDRFRPARQEYEASLRQEKLDPMVDQLRALQERLEQIPENDPQVPELRERFVRVQREASRIRNELAQALDAKAAEQLAECYELVRSSAGGVAQDLGYDWVLASSDASKPVSTDSLVSLMRDLLSRPALVAPEDSDITEDVRKDLNLD